MTNPDPRFSRAHLPPLTERDIEDLPLGQRVVVRAIAGFSRAEVERALAWLDGCGREAVGE